MCEEKAEAFGTVLDLRAANVRQKHRFDYAFTTDGVCARLQCARQAAKEASKFGITRLPTRVRLGVRTRGVGTPMWQIPHFR
jgi:hypothetical protein